MKYFIRCCIYQDRYTSYILPLPQTSPRQSGPHTVARSCLVCALEALVRSEPALAQLLQLFVSIHVALATTRSVRGSIR